MNPGRRHLFCAVLTWLAFSAGRLAGQPTPAAPAASSQQPPPPALSFAELQRAYTDKFLGSLNLLSGGGRYPAFTVDRSHVIQDVGKTYEVANFALIGASQHAPPVAFRIVAPHLEKVIPFGPVPRALTPFEESALKDLRTGIDWAVGPEQPERELVCAIRAQESCLKCHTAAKAGDVLGAFIFTLRELSPPSPATAPLHKEMRVSIVGQLNRPGMVTIAPGQKMTLATAVALAGGPTRIASREVRISRKLPNGTMQNFTVNLANAMADASKDVELLDGDSILVAEGLSDGTAMGPQPMSQPAKSP